MQGFANSVLFIHTFGINPKPGDYVHHGRLSAMDLELVNGFVLSDFCAVERMIPQGVNILRPV